MKCLFAFTFVLFFQQAISQSNFEVQRMLMPQTFSPAHVGEVKQLRLTNLNRFCWKSLSASMSHSHVIQLDKAWRVGNHLTLGSGVHYTYHNILSGLLLVQQPGIRFSIAYSDSANQLRKYVAVGLGAQWVNKQYASFLFTNNTDYDGVSVYPITSGSTPNYFDMVASIRTGLDYGNIFQVEGTLGLQHVNQPSETSMRGSFINERNWIGLIGLAYHVHTHWTITYHTMYTHQNHTRYLYASLLAQYTRSPKKKYSFITGLLVNYGDSYSPYFGLTYNHLKLGCSYAFSSQAYAYSKERGAIELGSQYLIGK